MGGEGHRTGDESATAERFARLDAFAREHWDVRAVTHRWSSQDAMPLDGLPLVGRATPRSERLLLATGFAKWGMTNGTAAAELLADLVQGRPNGATGLFDPFRLSLRSLPDAAREGAGNAWRLLAGPRRRPDRGVADLAPGDGAIVKEGGRARRGPPAADGSVVAVSPRCTHLGCEVRWNGAESSWDCPCHGSRFSPEGEVLHGPAVHRLDRGYHDRRMKHLRTAGLTRRRRWAEAAEDRPGKWWTWRSLYRPRRRGTDRDEGAAGRCVDRARAALRRFYGRGPTRAETIFDGDVITTVLADIFTTVEETLVDRGRHDLVIGVRVAFQDAMRHEFVATVERAPVARSRRSPAVSTSSMPSRPRPSSSCRCPMSRPSRPSCGVRPVLPAASLRTEGPDGRTSCSAVRAAAFASCSPARGAATMRRAHVSPPHRG